MALSSRHSAHHTSPHHRSFSTHPPSPACQGHPISPMRDEDDRPISLFRDEDINDDIEFVTRDDFRKTQDDIVKSMTMVTTAFSSKLEGLLDANRHQFENLQQQILELMAHPSTSSNMKKPSFTPQQFSGRDKQRNHEFVSSWINRWNAHFQLHDSIFSCMRLLLVACEHS